ncbi:MAG: glycosyltransferase family 39 protein [Blastocatellia bacterium]|nr:glycosyltransferase family 39 protein [Blastocatellia bacterium]
MPLASKAEPLEQPIEPSVPADALLGRDRRLVITSLVLLIAIGFAFRVANLGAVGFAEDEVNKVDAVRAYEHGDITANGEHPMLMKALMFTSVKASRVFGGGGAVNDEVAFRLPNAIFGALTVIPLFLLTAAFFDRWTGLLAAAFWSVGLNAITINRIGKEDTLLVFFMLFAFYFYLRAKQTSPRNSKPRRRHYILSGISFGLMMASKYFPHYFGLNALYHHYFHVRKSEPGEPGGKTFRSFYIALAIAFVIANPPVLLPQVWEYLNVYMGEKLLVHTGYLMGEVLYKNNVSRSPFWGTPLYFYLLFMAIKIPLAVLAAFVAGLMVSIKRWRHPGYAFALFMFFFWIVPYSLVGAKWLRYTLSLMPFVYMLAAAGAVALARFVSDRAGGSKRAELITCAAVLIVFVVQPAWSAYKAAPHYALYTNALAADKVGYYFPHDEFYDDGLREAIQFVCAKAPQGVIVANETPAATHYYLERFGSNDLNSQVISTPGFQVSNTSGPAYIIIQRGRTYFENRDELALVRSTFKKLHEVRVNGIVAAEVFTNQN